VQGDAVFKDGFNALPVFLHGFLFVTPQD
jgi:hypothetical protein